MGSIACVLALATLVLAFAEVRRQRRQMPIFQLRWDFYATTSRATDRYHVVEFRNTGRGSGEFIALTLCGARAHLEEEFLAPHSLGSGQTFRLLITSPDLEKAWVRYIYRTEADERRFAVEWQPLYPLGAMSDEWDSQTTTRAERNWFVRLRDRIRPRRTKVAPGGIHFGVLPRRNHDARLAEFLRAEPGDVFYSALVVGPAPTLPYVPPK